MVHLSSLPKAATRTRWQRRVAFGGIVLFIVVVASLHFIQPYLNARVVPVSEYVLGPWGWLMTIAFFNLSVGSWFTYQAVRSTHSFVGWKLGTIGLWVWIGGTAIAGCFATDAIGATVTWHGVIHGLASSMALISLIIVEMALVGRSAGQLLGWVSIGIGGGVVVVFVAGLISDSFGVSERVVIFLHCTWLMLITAKAEKGTERSSLTF